MRNRWISTALAVCLLAEITGTFPASAEILTETDLNYTESTEFVRSSDSGYSSGIWINAAPGKDWSSTSVTGFSLLLIGIGGYSGAMNADGKDYDFDEVFFTSLEAVLKRARDNDATVGLRFRYDAQGQENPEPASFDQVLRHIAQIGESGLLQKYKEVISFVETGMVGCWGEQWGGKYTSLENKAQVLDAFLNITPDSIPVTVRTPNTMRQWLQDYCHITVTAADMSYTISDPVLAAKASRIGLYNDGYMGSDSDLGTYSNRTGETAWLHEAPSYGGEFSGSDSWRMKYTTWQPENALPEMYYTNLLRINCNIWKDRTDKASFSTREEAQAKLDEVDALYEAAGLGDFDYAGEITDTDGTYTATWKWMGYDDFIFDKALDAKLGVKCDNSAFYGQTVWQFIRAHLGYRYVLRSSKLSSDADPGGDLQMQFKVENTGFSEAPKDKETEVLLTNGKITYTYTTDINARDWASAGSYTEELTLPVPQTIPGGEWDVYLRISDKNADPNYDTGYTVQFANADLQFDDTLRANYMGSLHISGTADAEAPVPEDHRPAGYYPDAEPILLDEDSCITLLDRSFPFTEAGHYGFTFLYKTQDITEEIQLGNWYAGWSIPPTGYASAYTTYGLNTMNLKLEKDGYYALHIPFYGAAFNCTSPTADGSVLNVLTFNDTRNYWSEDTYTLLHGTSPSLTPIGFVEGSFEGYEVIFHLPEEDAVYTGTYGFQDELTQSIRNVPAVTVLSLLDKECPESFRENGRTYRLAGFTTKEGDKSCLIDADFIAMGHMELYPFYELDRSVTDLNAQVSVLTNGADEQGVRYVLDDTNMTASVGDGSDWENNAGFSGKGSVVIPAYVESGGKRYKVTEISGNAFSSCTQITDIFLPGTIDKIGIDFACPDTVISFYEGDFTGKLLQTLQEYPTKLIKPYEIDVNKDGCFSTEDIVTLQKWLLALPVTSFDPIQADADGSGRINILDLVLLKRKLLAQNL